MIVLLLPTFAGGESTATYFATSNELAAIKGLLATPHFNLLDKCQVCQRRRMCRPSKDASGAVIAVGEGGRGFVIKNVVGDRLVVNRRALSAEHAPAACLGR